MEWEGVKHSFCPDRVWSSRFSLPMYPFMHDMNDMLHTWNIFNQIKSHKFIYERVIFFIKKKKRFVFGERKKKWFDS